MYYEEAVINGVLSFRTTPHTPFVEFSKEKLTERISQLEQKLQLQKESAIKEKTRIDPDKTLYTEISEIFKKRHF